MAQESRLQEMSLARAGNRAASCLRAAKRIVPAAGLLAALVVVCLPKSAQAQTPATAWGYMAGSENVNADDSATVPGSRLERRHLDRPERQPLALRRLWIRFRRESWLPERSLGILRRRMGTQERRRDSHPAGC